VTADSRPDHVAARPKGLPWRTSDEQPWCVYGADGRLVAYAGPLPPDPNPVRAELDAAAIVEAVNAYYGQPDA
jgi:hypothetical protein